MNSIFQMGWQQREAHEQLARELQRELQRPFPGNPPELLTPTRCKVLRPFGLGAGKVAEVDQVVELQRHDALSLAAIGKVQILDA